MFLLLHGSCQTKKQVLWPLDNVYLPILWGDSSYYGHFYTTSLSIVFHVLWVYFTWFLASFFVIINMLEFLINIFYFQFCNELTIIGISILILYAFSQVGMLSLLFPLWVLQLINWFFLCVSPHKNLCIQSSVSLWASWYLWSTFPPHKGRCKQSF